MKLMPVLDSFLAVWFGFLCLIQDSNCQKWPNIQNNVNRKFVSVQYNSTKHVRELRIAFKGVLMLETTAFLGSIYETTFHQITDGSKLVQTVSQNNVVKDCDYTTDNSTILQFVQDFARDSKIFYGKEEGDVF